MVGKTRGSSGKSSNIAARIVVQDERIGENSAGDDGNKMGS
jgi:hypothetical protein